MRTPKRSEVAIIAEVSHRDLLSPPQFLLRSIVGVAIGLFILSTLRHEMFGSGAWDLGIFDQAVYLISQGQTPVSSLLGFHILGDHVALIFYPLALLYKLYPMVHWLLAVQAIALALGALPTWQLARQAGATVAGANTLAIAYWLYPMIFNANLSDFHPETIAVPLFLSSVLAVRQRQLGWFCLGLVVICSCRDALALNVAGMGVWLLVTEKRRTYGAIALVGGLIWFVVATQVIIPAIGGEAAMVTRYLFRYASLGSSYSEIAKNLVLQPHLLIQQLFQWHNLEYLGLVLGPLIWACHPRHLAPLLGALPTLAMNILSDSDGQRSIVDQYSVPVIPFVILVAVATVAARPAWLSRRAIVAWSAVGFLALTKYGFFWANYLPLLDTAGAVRAAIAQIPPQASVLADHQIVPHLSHRPIIERIGSQAQLDYDDILINARHPYLNNHALTTALLQHLQTSSQFKLIYTQNQVYLFTRRSAGMSKIEVF
jgi:uncharacterized membrane protein